MDTGINLSTFGYSLDMKDQLRLVRESGFEAVFISWQGFEEAEAILNEAEKWSIRVDSVHAPFSGITEIWKEGEAGEAWVETLNEVALGCAKLGIPAFTMHCMNVPRYNPRIEAPMYWNDIGLKRFRKIVDYAGSLGIKACLENVEFPQHEFRRVVCALRDEHREGLGLTWDVGHEHCYFTEDFDVMDAFGDLLTNIHVHDNFGNTRPDVITWDDDRHLLPFDGAIDYAAVAAQLAKLAFKGVVMLEVRRDVGDYAPGRYRDAAPEVFFHTAHERALRLAALIQGEKEKLSKNGYDA